MHSRHIHRTLARYRPGDDSDVARSQREMRQLFRQAETEGWAAPGRVEGADIRHGRQGAGAAGRAYSIDFAAERRLNESLGDAPAPGESPELFLQALIDVIGAAGAREARQFPDFEPASFSAEERAGGRQVQVEALAGGQRVERYAGGGEVQKDSIGRVVEVVSVSGERVSLSYDSAGNLDAFVRTDGDGRIHSQGRRDKHGVVIRASDGRVRAAGESMTVDSRGRLCIQNQDGQFLTLDLVRGLHIERRLMAAGDGALAKLTAIFAHDGFRMVTRFQKESLPGARRQRGESPEHLRFYGRDGSLVQFASEDDLKNSRPAMVLSPGSLEVEPVFRGKPQCGTAWESVQEYLGLLS